MAPFVPQINRYVQANSILLNETAPKSKLNSQKQFYGRCVLFSERKINSEETISSKDVEEEEAHEC
jgi:hypothetical protein